MAGFGGPPEGGFGGPGPGDPRGGFGGPGFGPERGRGHRGGDPRADFAGRGDPRGGRGGHRGGWFGFGGGPGAPGGFDFRTGRKLSSGQLQLVLLALIGDKPRHGYDLIKAVDEKSGGFYVPSPGVIYPALTYLEEAGDVSAEAEGSRKLYTLTDAGKERLAKQREEVDAILAQLDAFAARMGRMREAFTDEGEDAEGAAGAGPWGAGPWAAHAEIKAAVGELFTMMRQSKRLSPEALAQVVAVIHRSAQAIRTIIEADQE